MMTARMFVPILDAMVFDRTGSIAAADLVPFQASLPCFRWEATIGDGELAEVISQLDLASERAAAPSSCSGKCPS